MANTQEFVEKIQSQRKQKQSEDQRAGEVRAGILSTDSVQAAVVETTRVLIEFLNDAVLATEIKNSPSVKTPDVSKVIIALKELQRTTAGNKIDLEPVIKASEQVQKEIKGLGEVFTKKLKEHAQSLPEVKIPEYPKDIEVNNLKTAETTLKEVRDAIKKLKLDPKIQVESPAVTVQLEEVAKGLDEVVKAVNAIEFPEVKIPEVDTKSLEKNVREVRDAIKGQKFPVPNYVLPFKDSDGKATQQAVALQAGTDFDYLSIVDSDTDEDTLVYKTGGSGGTTVRTVVITFTDSSKQDVASVAWS